MTMPALDEATTLAIQKSIWQQENEDAQKQAEKVQQGVTLNLQNQQAAASYEDAQRQYESSKRVLDTQLSQIDPTYRDENGLINAKQALLDLQKSQIDPAYKDQQKVFAAQSALNMAQSQQYQVQVQQLTQKRADLQALTAAQDNTQNQIDVAAGKRQRASFDTRYQAAGVSPQEIQGPLNGEAPTNLPPGVRFAIETDAERVARQNERNAAGRDLQLEGAGLNSAGAQLGVNQATLGRNVGDASRQRAVDFATVGASGAGLAADRNALARGVVLDTAKINNQQTQLDAQRAEAERQKLLQQQRVTQGLAGLGM